MRRRIGIASVLVLVALLLYSPVAMRYISLPHSSRVVERADADLISIAAAIKAHRRAHQGKSPADTATLCAHLKENPDQTPGLADSLAGRYAYFPAAKGDEPMVITYLHSGGKRTAAWVTADGAVVLARAWFWPRWEER